MGIRIKRTKNLTKSGRITLIAARTLTISQIYSAELYRERIEALLIAFAKVLAHNNMPSLEIANIHTYLWWHPSHSRAAEYGVGSKKGINTKTHRWGVKYVAGRSEKGGDAAAPTVE